MGSYFTLFSKQNILIWDTGLSDTTLEVDHLSDSGHPQSTPRHS